MTLSFTIYLAVRACVVLVTGTLVSLRSSYSACPSILTWLMPTGIYNIGISNVQEPMV